MAKISTDQMFKEFIESIALVNELRVPVVTREHLPLKERAKLTKKLFKSLGVKHIRAKSATGANCYWVEILFPMCLEIDKPERLKQLQKARLSLEEILLRAFPKEIDNSDMMSDYFDSQWTFHEYISPHER